MGIQGVGGSLSGLTAYAESVQFDSAKEDGKAAKQKRKDATKRSEAATIAKIDASNESAQAELQGDKNANKWRGVFMAIGAAVVAATVAAVVVAASVATGGMAAVGAAALLAAIGPGTLVGIGGLAAGAVAAGGVVASSGAKNKQQKIANVKSDEANKKELEASKAKERADDAKDVVQAALERKRRVLQGMEKRVQHEPRSYLNP
ncbi:MAG: hypothetical protein RIT81_41030 [Deltaproteobacteria bacterium]